MFGMNEIVGQKHYKNAAENTLTVTSRFFTIQGEGPFRGFPAYFIRLAKCNLACSFCFVQSTEITMSDGPRKKISEVVVGDRVVTYDEAAGQFKNGRVTKLYQSKTDELIQIRTGNRPNSTNPADLIQCTPEHPFLVRDRGWVEAKDLQPNDVLIHLSSSEQMRLKNPMFDEEIVAAAKERMSAQVAHFIHNGQTVRSVERINKGSGHTWTTIAGGKHKDCTVYNFEVEGTHTYVANGKVVHNCDTYFDSGTVQTFDQIFAEIDQEINEFYTSRGMAVPSWAQGNLRRIVLVVTGGEPTLQKNLNPFLERANELFFHTQIESNGTLGCQLPEKTTMVCSPKCLEKNNVAVRYLAPKPAMLERADCLKFVISAPEQEQFTPYATVPDWAHAWAAETGKQVFVSPMNIYKKEPAKAKELRAQKSDIDIVERSMVDEVISFWEPDLLDLEKNQRNHEYTAEYAMKHGFILNLQIHLFASLP